MSLRPLLGVLVLALLPACGGASMPGEAEGEAEGEADAGGGAGCTGDDQCRPGERCRGGACRSPEPDAPAARPRLQIVVGGRKETALDFGAPLIGAEVERRFRVKNAGQSDLLVSDIVVDEDDDDAAEYAALPSGNVGWRLAPAAEQEVTVTLRPVDAGADTGTVFVYSNDPSRAVAEVSLVSEVKGEAALDLCVLPDDRPDASPLADCADELDLDGARYGARARRLVRLLNDGTENRPLAVLDVELAGETGHEDLFDLDVLRVAGEGEERVFLPEFIAPGGDPIYLLVTFSAEVDGLVPREIVRITTDLADEPVFDVPVTGVVDGCPAGYSDANGDPGDGCEAFCERAGAEVCDGADNDCNGRIDEGCDDDQDGYCDRAMADAAGAACAPGDCNDANRTVHPGAAEVCNNVDDDCDGPADEDLAGTPCGESRGACEPGILSCRNGLAECVGAIGGGDETCNGIDDDCDGTIDDGCDDDRDGFCDAAMSRLAGAACRAGDCDDGDDTVHPDAAETCNGADDNCVAGSDEGCDDDLDGYCDAAMVRSPGAACAPGDCDDAANAVHPGAGETCDGRDQDCDGVPDDGCDDDGDGWCDATLPRAAGATCLAGDCDDARDTVHPGATEVCNGVDDNCLGLADEGCDDDTDGFCDVNMVRFEGAACRPGDCNDLATGINPGAPEQCNGLNDNCAGGADEGCDADGDGWCTANRPWAAGAACQPGDCDDGAAGGAIHPGAVELCNGVDDDCGGDVDEGCDDDRDGWCDAALGFAPGAACAAGDCDDNPATGSTRHPAAVELCNGVDDDCGGVDEGCDDDGDGWCDAAMTRAAGATCQAGDCDDGTAAVRPGLAEVCNGVDEDCDGTPDEGCDDDGDGWCDAAMTRAAGATCQAGDCNDAAGAGAAVNPGAAEVCGDGVDQDCDGAPDDGCAPECWLQATVDASASMQQPSIARDGTGALHAVYVDFAANLLRYATCASGCAAAAAWTTITVPLAGQAPREPALAIDGLDRLHVSYRDASAAAGGADLRYAFCGGACATPGNWAGVNLPIDAGTAGHNSSIFVDAFATVHVSYWDQGNADVKYARCPSATLDCRNQSGWQVVNLGTQTAGGGSGSGAVGQYSAIATDSSGILHLVYSDESWRYLMYRRCASNCHLVGSWTNSDVYLDTLGYTIQGVAVAVDANAVHVLWSRADQTLLYTRCPGNCPTPSFSTQVSIDPVGHVGANPALAVDAAGVLYAIYDDVQNNNLRYARCTGSCNSAANWSSTTVLDGNAQDGSCVLDGAGNLHVAYQLRTSASAFGFAYGRQGTGAACITCGAQRGLADQVASATVGQYTTLVASGSSYHAIYQDVTNTDLRYATCSANCQSGTGAWPRVAIDNTSAVGSATSAVLDAGVLHVAYVDTATADLRYARCAGSCTTAPWTIVTVDDAAAVASQRTGLAVDAAGVVVVSYHDSATNSVKLARCANAPCGNRGDWAANWITPNGTGGVYTSLAAVGTTLHLAWENGNGASPTPGLNYGQCTAGAGCTNPLNWRSTVVDAGTSLGAHNALAVEAGGAVHVSYHQSSGADLRYARCAGACDAGASWATVAVDTTNSVGTFTDLVVDAAGVAHLSYYDATGSGGAAGNTPDLRYARCATGCTASGLAWTRRTIDAAGSVGSHASLAREGGAGVAFLHHDATSGTTRTLRWNRLDNAAACAP